MKTETEAEYSELKEQALSGRLLPLVGLVSPPKRNKRDSMRLVKRVISGWPQAAYELTCGHRIIVPTWANGVCTPRPKRKWYKCHECCKTKGATRRFYDWYDRHGDAWYAAHPDD